MKTTPAGLTPALASLLLAVAVAGCWEDAPFDVRPEDRALVIEDPVILAARVTYFDEPLVIAPMADPATPGRPIPTFRSRAAEPRLTLIAEVAPPELEGIRLQATHVAVSGNMAYLSYNVQGAVTKGGVDAFHLKGQSTPAITSSLLLQDTDVSSVAVSGDRLFLATGAAEGSFEATAGLETVGLEKGGKSFDLSSSDRIGLTSFVATGVATSGSWILVTSGDAGGGLAFVEEETLAPQGFDPFPDARAIVSEGPWRVAMKGTPAALRLYDPGTGGFLREIPVGGANIPESKSGVAIAGEMAAVAAGESGIKLVDLTTGEIVDELPLPAGSGPDVSSNEVAIHEDLIFVANGGGGLWAARASDDIEKLGTGDDPALAWVGEIRFPVGTSVNFVSRKGDRLIVAGGSGGLKIVALDD